jgi:hypothetical protein
VTAQTDRRKYVVCLHNPQRLFAGTRLHWSDCRSEATHLRP